MKEFNKLIECIHLLPEEEQNTIYMMVSKFVASRLKVHNLERIQCDPEFSEMIDSNQLYADFEEKYFG